MIIRSRRRRRLSIATLFQFYVCISIKGETGRKGSYSLEPAESFKSPTKTVVPSSTDNSYERNLMLDEEMTFGAEKISIDNFKEKFATNPFSEQTINGRSVSVAAGNGYGENEQVIHEK